MNKAPEVVIVANKMFVRIENSQWYQTNDLMQATKYASKYAAKKHLKYIGYNISNLEYRTIENV